MNHRSSLSSVIFYAFRAAIPVMTGYVVLSIGFGILLRAKGFGLPYALLMSIWIYAGSMQYVAVDLLAGGASLLATAIMTLMVNMRHIFYGITMLERYQKFRRKYRFYSIFALTDETFSLVVNPALPENVPYDAYCFWVSLFDQLSWILGTAIGSLLGNIIPFDTTGIDFAMTALFVIIALEQWEQSKQHLPALTGLGLSLLCLTLFGSSNFLIPAMLLITAALFLERRYLEKKATV